MQVIRKNMKKMSRVPNTVFVQLELGGLAVLAEYTAIPTRLERLSSPAALPGRRLAHYLPECVRYRESRKSHGVGALKKGWDFRKFPSSVITTPPSPRDVHMRSMFISEKKFRDKNDKKSRRCFIEVQ